MNTKIVNNTKLDTALLPNSLATAALTGSYFDLTKHDRACFFFQAATMANAKTVIAQVMKATDSIATGAVVLTGAAATITASTNLKKALMTGNTIADASTVSTIVVKNAAGTAVSTQIYTCEDTGPVQADGEYASGANDTAACVNLAAAINAVQGDYVVALASTTTVILTVLNPGEHSITLSAFHATIVASALEAEGYVEIAAEDIGAFTHVALRLTTDDTILVGASVVRSGSRYTPQHAVAASKEL